MPRNIVFLISFFLISSLAAHGASFDCKLAKGFIETTICKDKELSELDSILGLSYKNISRTVTPSINIKTEQKKWLRLIRSKCETSNCLKEAYQQRIEALWTTERADWKTYSNTNLGVQFIYPGNRSVHINKNTIQIKGPAMGSSDYIIEFNLGEGSFKKGAKDTAIFEERPDGSWFAGIGRFRNPTAANIDNTHWKGIKTTVTCGISDNNGFHAAGGTCLWALLSNDQQYVLANTQGIVGLDNNTLRTLNSIRFIN